jgi:type I restriction enzyme S subunit
MATPTWKPAKLDELGFVGRGKSRHRPRNAAILYGGSYPFFQTGDIKAANFYLTDFTQTYSEEGLAQSKLWKPGTLCITIAANIAESAILGIEGCFPDSVVGFVADPDKADVRFIKYYMEILKLQMQSVSRGTTQDNLSLDKLLSFDFCVPPLPLQRRIAGILSAYDELIENNQRRIRILEDMACSLYREWFVHFRYPDNESVPLVDSPLGKIPHGWEVKKLGDVAATFRGRSYRSVDLADEGGIPFLNLKCLDRDGGFRRSGLKRYVGEFKEANRARKGDVVMAVTDMTQERRIVARAALVPSLDNEFGVFSMDLVRIEPKGEIPKPFLYSFFRYSSFADEVKQHANGANVLHLSPERITDFRFSVPPADLMERFVRCVAPSLEQMDVLQNQTANLRRTRDLLLPRLLSGQINVEATETLIEEAIA